MVSPDLNVKAVKGDSGLAVRSRASLVAFLAAVAFNSNIRVIHLTGPNAWK
jgi:hypothetical protein